MRLRGTQRVARTRPGIRGLPRAHVGTRTADLVTDMDDEPWLFVLFTGGALERMPRRRIRICHPCLRPTSSPVSGPYPMFFFAFDDEKIVDMKLGVARDVIATRELIDRQTRRARV